MNEDRYLNIPVRQQLMLHQSLTTLVSAALAGASLHLLGISLNGFGLVGLVALSLVYSLPVSMVMTISLARRMQRLRYVSSAWLRGDFRARISDRAGDDLGALSGQLDLLAHQLEHSERDLSEERERNARLADQVRELAVVEERNRLARDLHDGVKQYLFSLGMTASAVRGRLEGMRWGSSPERGAEGSGDAPPTDLIEMVTEVENSARTAQREMTRLIEDLRPVSLQETGLAAALNSYTLLFGAREHLLIYLDVQGSDSQLPLSTSEALYRLAQEALLNVARHAMATRVDIDLKCLPEQVILVLHDNGVGFDTSRPSRGLGLELDGRSSDG